MSDVQVMMLPPGSISKADREELRSAGIVVVEIENPSSVRFVRAGYEVETSDLLSCAASAISEQSYDTPNAKELFGKALAHMLSANIKEDQQ
ncbi:MAG: hypothetical protein AAGF55_01045 [Pseudomonadota bacterium]